MSATRPVIAITKGKNEKEYQSYADAIHLADGQPEFLDMVARTSDELAKLLERYDGLLLTGGADVHPDYYDYKNEPGDENLTADQLCAKCNMKCDRNRDEFEIPLAQLAYKRNLPMLGICRGFQVMNVVLDGGLIMDIRTRLTHPASTDGKKPSAMHAVCVDLNSRFYHIMWTWPCVVNSRHHQGISLKEMSPKLRASAFAPDGIVEAVEATDHPWAIAVQWHPERQADRYVYEPCKALFSAFVAAAGR